MTAICCAGTETLEPIFLRVMILLVDSGSTHTFVTKSFVERAGSQISPAAAVSVKVANGQYMMSDSHVYGLPWWTQGHTFNTDMRILDIGRMMPSWAWTGSNAKEKWSVIGKGNPFPSSNKANKLHYKVLFLLNKVS
jgi:hypothetical protein